GAGCRVGRGYLWTTALLLLQRTFQLPRRGGEVPGGSQDVGKDHVRAVRGEEPALADATFPHPDSRVFIDCPTTTEQRRPHHITGAERGARWHPVVAHQWIR